MIFEEEEYLAHYGILRRSGRYPWGSGGTQDARNREYLSYLKDMKDAGLSEAEIARGLGLTTTQIRAAKTIALSESKQADINMAQRLKDKGLSNVAIGERMGKNESVVRTLLEPGAKLKADRVTSTADMLKREVLEKGIVDVGTGVELGLGLSKEKLSAAIGVLEEEGYNTHIINVPQLGTGKETKVKVLVPPGVTQKEAWLNRESIRQIQEHTDDSGITWYNIQPPKSIKPNRVEVKYGDDGGSAADGVIYLRPGVKDLSLGSSNYAQVRIKVGNGHYLKGMAMYKDDLPDGVDVLFNTNKEPTGNKLDAFKKLKDDPDNPFGAVIKRQSGALNIVNEEGDWGNWSRTLASQFLSKQSPSLIRSQLDVTYENRKQELDEILALTNPTVRKKLLSGYADSVDSASVHLKAAALPRQATKVILPVNSLNETEVYAPSYKNGERVVLVRFPHGGTFEIPELTVNNRHPEAKSLLKDARDAIGINAKVAAQLSGADFDGDTVLVIPNNSGRVRRTSPHEKLQTFDAKASYPGYPGMKKMTTRQTGLEMGNISNLITDMTIQNASSDHLIRAVRHSMVVIDAEKHGLDWRSSERDHGIRELKQRYQGSSKAGASTLLSRARSEVRIPDRKLRSAKDGGPIDPRTGELVYVPTGKTYVDKNGKRVSSKISVDKLSVTRDANTLSSGTPVEKLYASHSNRLKALANTARLNVLNSPNLDYSPSAKKTYKAEVDRLTSALRLAQSNAPRERQAQIIANAIHRSKRQDNPGMTKEEIKKSKYQALEAARVRTGANKQRIEISKREWDAIQAGAISNNMLVEILKHTDIDVVKELATPKTARVMTPAKLARANVMLANGASRAEVAAALGVSLSTLDASQE